MADINETGDSVPQGVLAASNERAEVLYNIREHSKKIDHLEKTVFLGNGNRPLVERTTSLEATVATIKSSMEELKGDIHAIRKGQSVIVWKILGGMAALIAVFVAAVLAFVFK